MLEKIILQHAMRLIEAQQTELDKLERQAVELNLLNDEKISELGSVWGKADILVSVIADYLKEGGE